MATLPQALDEEEIKRLTVSQLKKEYIKIAEPYKKILDNKFIHCCKCNQHLAAETFYADNNYASGKFPICKRCILAMVEQRNRKTDQPNETKQSVQRVLMMLDLPYNDKFYEDCCKGADDGVKEKNRSSPFQTYITCVKSLPQWKGKTWKDSEFPVGDIDNNPDENVKLVQKTLKAAKKRFGNSFSNEDLMFLGDEYDDWVTRYECNNKSQEEVFESLALLKLQKRNAVRDGKSMKDIKDIDTLIQSWLDTGNLKQKQNVSNGSTDTLTFGQMIEKWEMEEPVPEPEDEFKDVDGIGKYIRVWFKGHLARILGIDNGYSREYDEYIKDYKVEKPDYSEDGTDDSIYSKVFGKMDGE